MEVLYETALYRSDKDYRIPDLVCVCPPHITLRGIEGGAELAIEILSRGDETYEKIPWYAAFGLRELLVVDPLTCAVEFFVLRGGSLCAALPDELGRVRSAALGVTFAARGGPLLELTWSGGANTILPRPATP
jgi:hypothetical protein